ncbi:MAG: hypothetical protein OXN95_14135, partial [bacterium]|nr:hypothetical protein [bacterium]
RMGSLVREEMLPSSAESVNPDNVAQSPEAVHRSNRSWASNVHLQELSGTGTPVRSRSCRQGPAREPDLYRPGLSEGFV